MDQLGISKRFLSYIYERFNLVTYPLFILAIFFSAIALANVKFSLVFLLLPILLFLYFLRIRIYDDIKDYKIQLDNVHINRLSIIYQMFYNTPQGEVEFRPKDIRKADAAKLAYLVHFGLLYWIPDPEDKNKPLKGVYGMNRKIVSEFLSGKRSIQEYFWVNKLIKGDGKYTPSGKRITIDDILTQTEIKGILGDKFTEYREVNELPNINLNNQQTLL